MNATIHLGDVVILQKAKCRLPCGNAEGETFPCRALYRVKCLPVTRFVMDMCMLTDTCIHTSQLTCVL